MANEITEVASKASRVDEKLRALKANSYSKIKDWSEEQIKSEILKIIKDSNVSENQLKLLGLALSVEDSSSALQSGANAYASALANKFYRNKENVYEQKKERPKSVFHVKFDKEKLKKLDDKEMKNYAYECLSQAGMPEELMNKPGANFENFNIEYQTNLSAGDTILDATTVLLIRAKQLLLSQEKKSEIIPAHLQNLLDEEDKAQTSHSTPEQKLPEKNRLDIVRDRIKKIFDDIYDVDGRVEGFDIDNLAKLFIDNEKSLEKLESFVKQYCETIKTIRQPDNAKKEQPNEKKSVEQTSIEIDIIKETIKNACQNTADINVAGGFDIDKVAPIFVGKKDALTSFTSFIISYNEIMNEILNHVLDSIQVTNIQDDINPAFQAMDAMVSQYGAEGAQLINVCKGLKTRIDNACENELVNGRQNAIHYAANAEYSPEYAVSESDIDGSVVDEASSESKETLSSEIDGIVGTKGLGSNDDALTEEDLRDMEKYGFTPDEFPTHSAYVAFQKDPEYLLHAGREMEFGPSNNRPNT